jgi:O-antigen/teichoic acid export membrane protein
MIESLRTWTVAKQSDFRPADSLWQRFTSGAFWSLAGGVVSRGSFLVASVGCARLLGRIGFGELGIIQSTAGTFGIFAGLGLGLTATKYVSQYRTKNKDRVGSILALSSIVAVASGVVMAGLLVMSASFLATHTLGAPELASPLATASGLVILGAMNGAQTGALIGLEAFRAIAKISLWTGVANLLLVICGAWYRGLHGAVWGLVAALGVNWLLNNIAIREECSRAGIGYDFRNFAREWRILYQFSLPAFLASIIVGPAMWICNALLVNRPNGYLEMGLYTAADKWRLLILFVPATMTGMALPMLSHSHGAGDQVSYGKILNANLLLCVALTALPAIAAALLSAPILSAYGPGYRQAWPILVILAFSAVPEAVNNILGYAAISRGGVWWRLAFDIVLAGALLGFCAWAIPRWGAIGLAGGYFVAFSLVTTGLLLFLWSRRLDTPHNWI